MLLRAPIRPAACPPATTRRWPLLALLTLMALLLAGTVGAAAGESARKKNGKRKNTQPLERVTVNLAWAWNNTEAGRIKRASAKLKRTPLKDDGDTYYTLTYNSGDFKRRPLEVRTQITPEFTAEVAEYFRLFLRRFPDFFPTNEDIDLRYTIRLFVYENSRKYHENLKRYFGGKFILPEWSAGVHVVALNGRKDGIGPELVIAMYGQSLTGANELDFCRDFNRSTLQHEGVHAMLSALAGQKPIPVFFNEGCATYFQSWNLRVAEPTKEERAERVRRGYHLLAVVAQLKKDPDFAPDLDACLMMTTEEWLGAEDDVASLNYGLAESFADFMLTDRTRRRMFREAVKTALERKAPPDGVLRLFDEKTIKRLEPQWHDHLRELALIMASTERVLDVSTAGKTKK